LANKIVDNPKRDRFKARKLAVKYKYNLEWEEYEALYLKANGCCEICEKPLSLMVDKTKETAYVDHCHATKKVRGILCRVCNVALGHFRDSRLHLTKALKYLDERS
jgi:hypothetical protein